MRTHLLLILVLAILTTCGCSARRGSWWPTFGEEYVDYGDSELSKRAGVEDDVSCECEACASEQRPGRFAFLNPFRRRSQDVYDGEVMDQPCCSGCGVEGTFPGNGQCDNCLQETVSEVLRSHGSDRSDTPEELQVLTTPGSSVDPSIPVAPSMEVDAPIKVVKPHAALEKHMPRDEENAQWQSQQFSPVQPAVEKSGPAQPEVSQREIDPTVPTTIVQDNRTSHYESSLPDWVGVGTHQKGPKPARIVNQFNDDADWANIPKPKSIAMAADQKMGGEPPIQAKTSRNKGTAVDFIKSPNRNKRQKYGSEPRQQDPEFEQFTLDDLFPVSNDNPLEAIQASQPTVSESANSTSTGPTSDEESNSSQNSAQSIMDDNIEWGLPNQGVNDAKASGKRGSKQDSSDDYSIVRERERDDYDDNWGVDDSDDEYDDESMYEDEEGVYDEDTDFGSSNTKNAAKNRFANRSEKDIIRELRNSTVPNRIVFDNSPQIPEQERAKKRKPVILVARPVPHYQELRQLAKMEEDEASESNSERLALETLPTVGKTPAIPVSSRRVVEEVQDYDFQPLPNLLVPTPLGIEEPSDEYWQNEAFDPDSILDLSMPAADEQTSALPPLVEKPGTPIQSVNSPAKKNSVPIILKAAPTFATGGNDSESKSNTGAKAKIRFIKPSFQRELK